MQSLYKYPDCQYGLLFEDDVIAAPSWYEKLATSLRELDDQRPGKWLCLKLFTAFRYYDWITHIPTLVRSVIFVLASIVIQTLLFHILQVKSLKYPSLIYIIKKFQFKRSALLRKNDK